MTTKNFFSCFLQLDIYRKRFEALKVLEKCKEHFFPFKSPAICLQICPGHCTAKIAHDIVYLNATLNMAKVHNVMSRVT